MLAAAGGPPHLKLLYQTSFDYEVKMFQTLQADLGKVGISVSGAPAPSADFYTKYLQVPSVAHRGRLGPRPGQLVPGLVRQRGPVVLQAAVLGTAGLPAGRKQLRLLQQPRHQPADHASRHR